ncbi:hypothetical protein CTI12_AA202510 [Artemisia annua]|uniref:Uncharacterized protein n=1 Tax=Artemisia annua TaxID=35608 RepID=A0A2U1P262_ARTAN|nr:hypothetical protein CTI12_AA202510 [Artemisia annua]
MNETLTFCSRYLSGVGTKFNHPAASQDCPRPTSDFQVFRSLCKKSGKETLIRLGLQEMKKVIWYVLHNNPEIDTYLNAFEREFPDSDMSKEFASCRDIKHTTQNSGICSPGEKKGEMYYGQLEEILEFAYAFEDQPYILATEAKQYLEDPGRRPLHWKDIQYVNHNTSWDVIVVEDDDDIDKMMAEQDSKIKEVEEDNKATKRQLIATMNVLQTNPKLWSQLIRQMPSQTEVGSGSGSVAGEGGSGSGTVRGVSEAGGSGSGDLGLEDDGGSDDDEESRSREYTLIP